MRILFAGGGTGGHINPALAIAKHIKEKDPECEIRFAGATGQMEEKLVPRAGFQLYTFPLHGIKRSIKPKALLSNVKALWEAGTASMHARKIIHEFRPDIIVGTGGYASFPVAYAGTKTKIPTVLLEVNAMPGMVTRKLSGKVSKVLISYKETLPYLDRPENAVITGNPVRGEIAQASRLSSRQKLGLGSEPLVVSFWGSLGALYMNEKMVDFIKLESHQNAFNHIHAAGKNGASWMPQRIEEAGVCLKDHPNIELRDYIYDMDTVLSAADLVICRAGASTLSEICLLGKPSIIIPSPNVTDNHQEKNARALEHKGACLVLLEKECTGQLLFDTVNQLIKDPEKLRMMGENAKRLALPCATEMITKELYALAGK